MKKHLLTFIIIAILLMAIPGVALATDANNDGYRDEDVAVINKMIENNGLNWAKDDPVSWGSRVEWDISTEKNIVSLDLLSSEMTGVIDLRGLDSLVRFECGYTNITGIDLSNVPNLLDLLCYDTKIEELDLSGVPNLDALVCSGANIIEIDLSKVPNLRCLDCSDTNINSLNISGLSQLDYLDCSETNIAGTFDVTSLKNLQSLDCCNTNISQLNVSNLPELEELFCSQTNITELDLRGLCSLEWLSCEYTNITELDLSNVPNLLELHCPETNITELDLSGVPNLQCLNCEYTNITSLDLSDSPMLTSVYFSGNALESFTDREGNTLRINTKGKGSVIFTSSSYDLDNRIVRLSAQPSYGEDFLRWTEIPENATVSNNTVSFYLQGDQTVTASFTGEPSPYKQFRYYDANTRAAYFTDGSMYPVIEDARAQIEALAENNWVKITLGSAGAYIVEAEKVRPKLKVEITLLDDAEILFRDGKLGYDEYSYKSKSDFEIGYCVSVTNITSVDGISTEELRTDPSLYVDINGLNISTPKDFNLGWFGGGKVSLKGNLGPSDAMWGEGYIRAGTFYEPKEELNEYNLHVEVLNNTGYVSSMVTFKIRHAGWEEEVQDNIADLAKEAGSELKRLQKQFTLDPNVIEFIFGIKDEELFKQHMLTAIVLSNPPEKTFQNKVDERVLGKFFGKYQTNVSADSYTLPLYYRIKSPDYGNLTVRFDIKISTYSLDGVEFGRTATVGYKIVSKPDKNAKKQLNPINKYKEYIGGYADADVEAFSNAAYELAETKLEEAYDEAWGNSADKVAGFIFGEVVNEILEAYNTSVSDQVWSLMTWYTQDYRIKCPVNIYVYDSSNLLCGSIEYNEVTKQGESFTLSVDGDAKYIEGIDESYTIQYVAYDDGEMDIEIIEYLGHEEPARELSFYDIPLRSNGSYEQSVGKEILPDKDEFQLISDTNEQIVPDEEEILADILKPIVDGWNVIEGVWYYYKDGEPVDGWLNDEGVWRYLDEGKALYGFHFIDGYYRYFADGSVVLAPGLYFLEDAWRCILEGGIVCPPGFHFVDGYYRYVGDGGILMPPGWYFIDDAWRYFAEGSILLYGWNYVDEAYRYFGDGSVALYGWHEIDGQLSWFEGGIRMETAE